MYCTYSYAVNTDVLKQNLHLICDKPSMSLRVLDDISLLIYIYFSSKIKWTFSVFLGGPPEPRPGYQISEPNGCSSSLVGLQVNAVVGSLLIAPAAQNCIFKPMYCICNLANDNHKSWKSTMQFFVLTAWPRDPRYDKLL